MAVATSSIAIYFNPRFPRGKRHRSVSADVDKPRISIHASRGESDPKATLNPHVFTSISIHASRGGSDRHDGNRRFLQVISIHASRGGSDIFEFFTCWVIVAFQSTLPAGEATFTKNQALRFGQFQSTLPAGEATKTLQRLQDSGANFNPRFPRGKRPFRHP